MLLKYGLDEEKAAKRIEDAVLDTLNRGFRTGDIYSTGTVCTFFIFFTCSFFVSFTWVGQRDCHKILYRSFLC